MGVEALSRGAALVEAVESNSVSADVCEENFALLSSLTGVGKFKVHNKTVFEFLIGLDGTISFLEVNTRLQVEHPVSEEITGIDLVREQFRIAAGEALGFDDPVIRGHSIEFRINGEDPGRSFLPAPGRITEWVIPTGPGVRVDAGFKNGDTIGGNFDSLLAKLIVTGATREQAIERARRALAEFSIEGLATALPFHRAIMEDPAFTQDFKVFLSLKQ